MVQDMGGGGPGAGGGGGGSCMPSALLTSRELGC